MRPYLQRQVLYQSVSLRFARWASIWQVENLGSITLLIAPFCLSFASLNLCNHYRALNFIQNFCQCRSRRSHNYIFLSIVPMMWIIRQIQFPVMACIIITKNQRTIIPNILVNIHQTICTNFHINIFSQMENGTVCKSQISLYITLIRTSLLKSHV